MTDHDREAFEAWRDASIWVTTPEFMGMARSAFNAALAHRDKDIADLQRQLDELVGAVALVEMMAIKSNNTGETSGLAGAVDRLRALATRIKTTQPKESSDGQ